MKKRAMLIFGTRPEAIKMAPLVHALQGSTSIEPFVVVTGQHREMLDQVLSFFEIRPEVDLDLMTHNQSLANVSASIIAGVDQLIARQQPDVLIVQGDTASSAMAALTGFYRRIPIAHVEAGLRTFDRWSPFPEEINRQLIGRVAEVHFPPTETAAEHLRAEGVPESSMQITGNTAIDALHQGLRILDRDPERRDAREISRTLASFGDRRLVLVTGHRRENLDGGIAGLCRAIRILADEREDLQFLFPVHRNPRVSDVVRGALGGHERITLTDPLPYDDFILAMRAATLILTDSGGIQEEAPSLGKPVLVTRDTTERPEAVAAGTARLIGCSETGILSHCRELLDDAEAHARMSRAHNPFGDGRAATRIRERLEAML